MAYELDVGSDHLLIFTEIEVKRYPGGHKVPKSPEDNEEYAETIKKLAKQWRPEIPKTESDLDAMVEKIA